MDQEQVSLLKTQRTQEAQDLWDQATALSQQILDLQIQREQAVQRAREADGARAALAEIESLMAAEKAG